MQNISIDRLDLSPFSQYKLDVRVLRLDKIHPEISGNKWFKLRHFLKAARIQQKERLISFGGPYSNHIAALACAAHSHGFSATGFIRGEKPPVLSHTLQTARHFGMELRFLPRSEYLNKTSQDFLTRIQSEYTNAIIIPEGGSGENGVLGAMEILSFPDAAYYSHICAAVGTGTTLAGLANAAGPEQRLIGIPVLKGTRELEPLDLSLVAEPEKISLMHDYHFGGYARKSEKLFSFMNMVYDATGIPTDFVYTGKLFYAAADLARQHFFPEGSQILLIHSGGLQGNLSLPAGLLHF